jgi:hypothetical protein
VSTGCTWNMSGDMRAQRYVHRPAIRGSWSPVVPPLPLRRCFLLALGYLYLQRCSAGSMSASPGLQALQHDAYTAVCRAFYAQTALSWVSNLTPALSCVMPWAGRTGKRAAPRRQACSRRAIAASSTHSVGAIRKTSDRRPTVSPQRGYQAASGAVAPAALPTRPRAF